ncbi:disease resistance protein RPH8A-like [Magnolia sinica]|uniref:disease resistance protein RPH8A-like n=1 Tax=Magnolia sinica TaxID=86752 RepID=UPI0026592AD3|nr:disease resistance protein RPH8A-like [Magnolia sinica]
MPCFLKDTDTKQSRDARVKNWVADIRDVAYNAEDVIDTFILEIERYRRSGFVGFFKWCPSIDLLAQRKIRNEIEQIKNKIGEISASRLTYGIKDVGEVVLWVKVYEEIKTLVARLIDGDSRHCVVSVVGMGGLGKTTLAIKVYNKEAVKKRFDFCAWVFVSQQHVERRFLVVLDDIWNTEAWDSLLAAFPDMNKGSRVLLTTHNRDVASYADPQSSPQKLQLLGDEVGWKLFCNKTFLEQGIHYPQNLEKLGEEIVKKCCRLALAIVVNGGLLSRKAKDPNEWGKALQRISTQSVDDKSRITNILSYEDLPYHLKPYFLYFGIFPEDHEISAKKLIRLWVTEGFIEPTGEETVEEAADDCLEELIHRSLIQVVKRNFIGRVKSCRIHDLLLELSISKAKEDKFLNVHRGDTNPLSPSKACRLAIHHAISRYTSLNHANQYLRFVSSFTLDSEWLGKKQEEFLYSGFSLLRVLHLDVSNPSYVKLPNEICRLIHLRYLGFRMCLRGKLEKPPEWYEFSPNLSKLTLELSKLMVDPMATLEKLPNLRILRLLLDSYMGKEMVCSAQGFPQLESLHVIQLPELEEWIIEEGAMPRLLHLLIWNCYHLKMLPGLQHVTILKKLVVGSMPNEFKDRMRENGGED